MNNRFVRACIAATAVLSLSACSTVKQMWPFGGDTFEGISKVPADATAYQCGNGQRFYVRKLDDDAVWLTLPDRGIRLSKTGEARYGAGEVALELAGGTATVSDGRVTLKDCKVPAAN